jgi:hypothetical protein
MQSQEHALYRTILAWLGKYSSMALIPMLEGREAIFVIVVWESRKGEGCRQRGDVHTAWFRLSSLGELHETTKRKVRSGSGSACRQNSIA